MTKLNIGSGEIEIAGFTAIDRDLGTEAYPLDYADDSVDEIRASHILEHFAYKEVPGVLADWVRVLKPGSRLRVAVPDVVKALKTPDDEGFFAWLMGGQQDANDFHRSAFDEKLLRALMAQSGLTDISPWTSENTDCASLPVSLNLEGRKPSNEVVQDVSIAAVISIPRLGWNDHWGCIHDALRPWNIPVHRFTGAFWGQCMQRALTEMLEKNVDWVLCLDYDSMFTCKHLDKLLGHLGENAHIDAVCGLQSRRQKDTPLMTVGMQTEVEWDGKPIKVTTAHFGFTLLRVECLRNMPKPWLWSEPCEDGEWNDGKLDDDIFFWHQWRKAGHNIYVAPDVRIGHLEMMVSQFDEEMNHQLVTTPEWYCANKIT